MAASKSTPAKKSATRKAAPRKAAEGALTAEERDAMKELVAERRRAGKGDGEADLLAKVAEMPEPDRRMAERIHAIVRAAAPDLAPKTWYGMPAYTRDDKVVVFFQSAAKFKARYATLGFNDPARLDDGNMWPTSYALLKLDAATEERIAELVKQAAG